MIGCFMLCSGALLKVWDVWEIDGWEIRVDGWLVGWLVGNQTVEWLVGWKCECLNIRLVS